MLGAKFENRKARALLCLLTLVFWISACSIPNLESAECTEARETARGFYSWYFGTSAEDREKQKHVRTRYVSTLFQPNRTGPADWEKDPFTLTRNFPSTFRIGKCELESEKRAEFEVQLLWRPGELSEDGDATRTVRLTLIKEEDGWKAFSVYMPE